MGAWWWACREEKTVITEICETVAGVSGWSCCCHDLCPVVARYRSGPLGMPGKVPALTARTPVRTPRCTNQKPFHVTDRYGQSTAEAQIGRALPLTIRSRCWSPLLPRWCAHAIAQSRRVTAAPSGRRSHAARNCPTRQTNAARVPSRNRSTAREPAASGIPRACAIKAIIYVPSRCRGAMGATRRWRRPLSSRSVTSRYDMVVLSSGAGGRAPADGVEADGSACRR
jgi:hypothetical protein